MRSYNKNWLLSFIFDLYEYHKSNKISSSVKNVEYFL